MAATISTGALAGAVRALRDAVTRDEIRRIETAFAAAGAPAEEIALLADVALVASGRLEAREEARRDVLTGVLNRRGFQQAAEAQLAACPGPVAVVVTDVDGLKAINDRLGHDAGSRTLRAAATALADAFPGAVVGRMGGDEFAALVPDRSEVAMLARRLATTVQAGRLGEAPLRLSAGFATGIAVDARDLDDLLRAADADLYRHRSTRRRHEPRHRQSHASGRRALSPAQRAAS